LVSVAKDAVNKPVAAFWIENGLSAPPEVEEILAEGKVQLVEYENLLAEYIKHTPTHIPALPGRKEKKAAKVRERMTRNPATVRPEDGLQEAIWKMERGHFRHLPVVDDTGKLVGMLSDRRHTRLIAEFGGLKKVMPRLVAVFLLATLSSIGLPGLNGFVGEFLILLGTWTSAHRWWSVAAATGVILSAIYMLSLVQRVFWNRLGHEENRSLPEIRTSELTAAAVLVVLMVWIGVRPNDVLSRVQPTVDALDARVLSGPARIARLARPLPPAGPTGTEGRR
jgi:CBS domain-containing protein